ncbi:ABC transporter ATP-binding protein YxdL [Sporotomaculum syntrophicum]|uniref:ABC transporter ATP-binding protein YxdL n=1 Tax=Sporotomaculum syntrophicum TaxID=182264 RepID=A0A9D2WNL8_9FIRM|nr:ABC transporter ATP-binding protein [Sporotomaculum syntrophicum]KAF1084213.1 ABC transporter ATP-binding protein YxdL [Sporotomaculum syntrophicum]
MIRKDLLALANDISIEDLLIEHPIVADFLANLRLDNIPKQLPLSLAIEEMDEDILQEFGLDKFGVLLSFCEFMETFSTAKNQNPAVATLTIIGGLNKSGEPENISLTISSGEIVSIVGPTGSGKSRLLNDIECLAQGDTPTMRRILVNGVELDDLQRFEMEGKLVAQLSQNMNFVMDLTVREFLYLHAKSRLTVDAEQVVEKCFLGANALAGEKFLLDTKITQLSGGQSRALMIADTAYISNSPIVLIDEIENAGIDRRQAIELLAQREKLVFISTHDPLLALGADKRIVIKNGGIIKILEITQAEKQSLNAIEELDNILQNLRHRLREGDQITVDLLKA